VSVRATLCLLLVLALGGLPLLPALHLEDEHHVHRYCQEHQRFEVVATVVGAPSSARSSGRPPADELGALAVPVPDTSRHVACPVLNHSPSRDPLGPSGVALEVSGHPLPASLPGLARDRRPSCPLLLVAPKIPPPRPA